MYRVCNVLLPLMAFRRPLTSTRGLTQVDQLGSEVLEDMYEGPYAARQTLSPLTLNPPSPAMRRRVSALARLLLLAFFCVVAAAAFSPLMTPILHRVPWREAGHFGAFFVITCAAALSFPKVELTRIAILGVLAGGLIEVVQSAPWIGRDCTLLDWAADGAGVAAVIAVSTTITFRQAYAVKAAPRRPDKAHRSFRTARAARWPGR
jgi:VanZ family protein